MPRGRSISGKITSKVPIPEDHAFATPGEIAGREHEAHQEEQTRFANLGPEDQPGLNIAHMDQNPSNRSGKMKWSRYSA